MLRFMNPNVLDKDIPRRTKMRNLILEEYQRVFAAICTDLKASIIFVHILVGLTTLS